MLPGWHVRLDHGRWVYLRGGPRGVETHYFSPSHHRGRRVHPAPHELGAIWYPAFSALAHIANVLKENSAILRWAHSQAERVLAQDEQYPNTPAEYRYPQGDLRPAAPPIKAAPAPHEGAARGPASKKPPPSKVPPAHIVAAHAETTRLKQITAQRAEAAADAEALAHREQGQRSTAAYRISEERAVHT